MKIIPNEDQEKKMFLFCESIISLVPKGFHKMCGSQILGTLFSALKRVPKLGPKNF